MTRKFDREEREIERLQKENRELKAQVRSLSKRLKSVSKGYYKFLAEESEDEKENIIEKTVKEIAKICWTCRIGTLQRIDIGNRYLRACNNCEYRTKTKTIQKRKKVK